jgi:hypothetical protein
VRHSVPFLLCDRCGQAIELEDVRITALLDEQAKAVGFTPRAQTLEVHGLCADCAPGNLRRDGPRRLNGRPARPRVARGRGMLYCINHGRPDALQTALDPCPLGRFARQRGRAVVRRALRAACRSRWRCCR